MSSFLCFICHSTVNSETNEETREKYKEVVGIHLCPDSHLCYICCHVLHKLFMYRSVCLKRSLEYPVLFSEKGTINLHRSDIEITVLCPDDCDQFEPKQYYTNDYHEDNYNINNEYFNDYVHTNENYTHDNDNDTANNDNDLTYDNVNDGLNDNQFDDIHNMDVKSVNNDVIENNDNDKFETEVCNEMDKDNNEIDDGTDNNDLNENNDNFNNIAVNLIEHGEFNMNNVKDDVEFKDDENGLSVDNSDESFVRKRKVKKKGFKKIVRTLEEQKKQLERNRKNKKYIEAEFKCYNCALGFLFKDTYQAHMMRHEESNGSYRCDTCSLRFSTHALLRTHAASHAHMYKCLTCGDVIGPRARRTHACVSTRVKESVACPQCGNLFRDANGLQQHIRRVHAKTSNRIHSCAVCNENFTNQSVLRTHMIKHIKRKFQCDVCPRIYSSPYTLAQHKKTHGIPVERHCCTDCDAVYTTRKSLLAHRRNSLAHQNTVFECPVCPRVCASQSALLLHSHTHSPARYECTRCSNTYSSRKSLVRHLRKHDGTVAGSIAVCHVCGSSFKGTNKLNRHLRENCEKAKLEDHLTSMYE